MNRLSFRAVLNMHENSTNPEARAQTPEELVAALADSPAQEVVTTVANYFGEGVALACSFQKEESVLLHMLVEAGVTPRVFALDTGVLFDETYSTWKTFEERFSIEIDARQGISLEQQEAEHGPALWETKPDACCRLRKIEPLQAALSELDAWITGVRRVQAPTRANAAKFERDVANGLWKANPLADWDDDQVWAYIREYDLPYNALHDDGYSSIGCTHCTLPGAGREGRWAGEEKTECGLHPSEGS